MTRFTKLHEIIPYADGAFETFYNTMLRDTRLAIYFKDDAQIKALIEKQKSYFIASLGMQEEAMRTTYVRLGEYHYELKIPYVDFIKGSEILQQHFILATEHAGRIPGLSYEIFEYFGIMKAYTAKGYLNKMIESDLKDIAMFTQSIDAVDQEYLPNKITLNKINWLQGLLKAIASNTDWTGETRRYFDNWKQELKFIPEEKKPFFSEMEERILYDTENLFYFLNKNEYSEILPLYTSLLNIYKLSLIMNNALTIKYANKVIHELKLDQLTLLFRKELFETMIVKEMAMVNRDPDYYVSVAFIDLDDFKAINDRYGHFVGDEVLQQLGKTIRKHTRISDMGFRIGGDEIAVMLRNARAADAEMICRKIKEEFTAYEFTPEEHAPFHVSVSIGINEYNHDNQQPFELFFKEIDRKLYTAKKEGKNRIVAEAML